MLRSHDNLYFLLSIRAQVSSLVTHKLEAIVEAADGILLDSKCEAIYTLFVYVILEQREQRMTNSILRALLALEARRRVTWSYIGPYTSVLFRGPNTPSMNSFIIHLSPYIGWHRKYHSKGDVIRWAAAALAVPYTEEVGRDIVGALLRISIDDFLRPHIPMEIWTWLKKHSTFPPPDLGRGITVTDSTLRYIRSLGDIEISKSYLRSAWSERNTTDGGNAVERLLREDFCGIGMWGHRKDLVEWLDRVLESCNRSPYYHNTWHWDELLRRILLEVETEAVETLIRMLPKLSFCFIGMLICANGDAHRFPLHIHLCSTPPLPMTSPHTL